MKKNNSSASLSSSKSKQKYSFAKAQRFPKMQSMTSMLSYSIDLTQKKPSITFGSSKRNSPFKSSSSAPLAKYNIRSSFDINILKKNGPSFSTGRQSLQRTNLSYSNSNSNPGPGNYFINLNQSKPITIGSKEANPPMVIFLNQRLINNNPSPAAYNIQPNKPKGGKITSLSIRFINNKKQNLPGVGTYNIDHYPVDKKSQNSKKQTTKFSKSRKVNFFEEQIIKSIAPGPKYNIPSQFD